MSTRRAWASIAMLVGWFAGLAWIEGYAQEAPAPVTSSIYRHQSHIDLRLYQLSVMRERRVRWRQAFLSAFVATGIVLLSFKRFSTMAFLAVLCVIFGAIEIPRRVYAVHYQGQTGTQAGYLYAGLAEKHIAANKS